MFWWRSVNFRAIMGPFLIGFSSGQQLSQEIWGLWLFISLLTWFYITKEKSCRLFRTNSGSLRRRVQGWDNITSQLYQTGQFKAEFVENDLRCSPCSSFWRRDASLGRRRSGRRRLGTGSCRPPPSSWSENLTNDKLEIWTNFQMSPVDVMQRLYFVEAEECFWVHSLQS